MITFNKSISSFFPREIINAAELRGVFGDLISSSAGVSKDVIFSESARVTPLQFAMVIRSIIESSGDEFFCLGPKNVKRGHFKMMAELCLTARTLGGVYKKMAKFYALTLDWMTVELGADSDVLKIRFKFHDQEGSLREKLLMEIMMILWHRFPSWLVDHALPLSQVQTDYSTPAYHREYRLMYPCHVVHERDKCGFDVPVEYLNMPIKKHPDALSGYLRNAPLDWFTKQQYSPQYTKRILTYLQEAEDIGSLTIESLANHLHMCSRTLRRKLNEENTNFSNLKNDFRRDLAIKLLSGDNLSLQEIAITLGFSEISAFSRAFRSWTGVSPRAYRLPKSVLS